MENNTIDLKLGGSTKQFSSRGALVPVSHCFDNCPFAESYRVNDNISLITCNITGTNYQYKGNLKTFAKNGVPIGCPFITNQ